MLEIFSGIGRNGDVPAKPTSRLTAAASTGGPTIETQTMKCPERLMADLDNKI